MSLFLFDDEIFEEDESDVDASEDSSEQELEELDEEEAEVDLEESSSESEEVEDEETVNQDEEFFVESESDANDDGEGIETSSVEEEGEEEEEFDELHELPRVSFLSVDDDLFNISDAHDRHIRDYSFFLKFQKLNHVTHYVHNKEPFTHVYEKNYWKFSFFDKFCYFLRNRLSPLVSSPFSSDGECSFFEFETLYSPQRCIAYSLRTRELSGINLKRFSRSLQKYTSDVYEDILIEGIDSDDSEIKLGRFVFSPGGVKFVDDTYGKDDIPQTEIDRHAWPSVYIDKSVNSNL